MSTKAQIQPTRNQQSATIQEKSNETITTDFNLKLTKENSFSFKEFCSILNEISLSMR